MPRLASREERVNLIKQYATQILGAFKGEHLKIDTAPTTKNPYIAISNDSYVESQKGKLFVPSTQIFIRDMSFREHVFNLVYSRQPGYHENVVTKSHLVASIVSPVHHAAVSLGLEACAIHKAKPSDDYATPAISGDLKSPDLVGLKSKLEDTLDLMVATHTLLNLGFRKIN